VPLDGEHDGGVQSVEERGFNAGDEIPGEGDGVGRADGGPPPAASSGMGEVPSTTDGDP
jgi:hypothetical protein